MKKIVTLIACYALMVPSFAQDPNFLFAKKLGGKSTDYAGTNGMERDAFGNLYFVGSFNDTADFNPNAGENNLISNGNFDIFICKLDSNGNFIWAKSIGSTGADFTFTISVTPSGNVYVGGYVNGTVDMDPGAGVVNISASGLVSFVLKLTSAGNFVWVKQFDSNSVSGTDQVYFQSSSLDNTENIFLCGMFGGTVDFDPDTTVTNSRTSSGGRDAFILKLSSAGNYQWAHKAGSIALEERALSLALDANASVYITGYFSSTVDFNPSPGGTNNLISAGGSDVFVWKLDAAGNYVWAKQFSGNNDESGDAIAVDDSGYVYTAGSFRSTVDFDPGAGVVNFSNTHPNDDLFLSVLNNNGAYVDARHFGDTLTEHIFEIALDADRNLYISGSFGGTVNFSTGIVNHYATATGNQDGFILKLDQAREFKWLQQFSTTSFYEIFPYDLLLDPQKNVYTYGHFRGTGDFDPGSGTAIIPAEQFDVFFVKLGQSFASGFNYSPSPVCKNATVNFTNTSVGAISYSWTFQGGTPATSTQQNPSVVFTSTGNKTVKLVASNGTSTDTTIQVINVKGLPTATITPGGSLSFCSGGSVLLSANIGTGLGYAWFKNNVSISGATASNYTATVAGSYKVAVTNNNGCSSTSSAVTVTVNSIPSAAVTAGGPLAFCVGDSVILSAPAGANKTYLWKKGANYISGATASTYTAKESGTYRVTVTNTLTGCSGTTGTGTVVTKNALPAATVTPQGPTTFCAGQSVVLLANNGANLSYQWRKNNVNISGANSQSYTAFVAGNYKVIVTNTSTGCTKTSATVVVVVNCRIAETVKNEFNAEAVPNPFTSSITLTLDVNQKIPVSIAIYSSGGRLIEKLEAAAEQKQITIGNGWSKGIYLVRLKQGWKEQTLHIIKQ